MMSDRNGGTATDQVRTNLLRKLENPLAFIGESRLSHICFDGQWTPVEKVFERARKNSRSKDEVASLLRERLEEIKSRLGSEGISRDEARTLFEEGIAVKHAIYVIGNNVIEEGDPLEDIKRWIKFGKSMG